MFSTGTIHTKCNMKTAFFFALILTQVLLTIAHASDLKNLEIRNKNNTYNDAGKQYESKVVIQFWGNTHFMMQCISTGAPVHRPFTIFFEVLPDGKMGRLAFTITTNVTKCISNHVKTKIFLKPEKAFVARIDLSFTK